MNLILAVVWFAVGIAIIAWQTANPDKDQLYLHVGGTTFSSGWVAIALGVWNLFRWWLRRFYREQMQATQQSEEDWRQRRRQFRREEEGPVTPDPNFDFSKPDPPEEKPNEPPAT